jgi:hypothetical protein
LDNGQRALVKRRGVERRTCGQRFGSPSWCDHLVAGGLFGERIWNPREAVRENSSGVWFGGHGMRGLEGHTTESGPTREVHLMLDVATTITASGLPFALRLSQGCETFVVRKASSQAQPNGSTRTGVMRQRDCEAGQLTVGSGGSCEDLDKSRNAALSEELEEADNGLDSRRGVTPNRGLPLPGTERCHPARGPPSTHQPLGPEATH